MTDTKGRQVEENSKCTLLLHLLAKSSLHVIFVVILKTPHPQGEAGMLRGVRLDSYQLWLSNCHP